MVIPDWLLSAAAWVYIHWRTLTEIGGFALIVAAAAFIHIALALAAAGIALLLMATYAGRSR